MTETYVDRGGLRVAHEDRNIKIPLACGVGTAGLPSHRREVARDALP